jgi:hypothetical protein
LEVQLAKLASHRDAAWGAQLAKLEAYRVANGDCNVKRREDTALNNWVLVQRAQKRQLDRGETCPGLTAARAAKLEEMGIVWETMPHHRQANNAAWEAQLAKLQAYSKAHGDAVAPFRYSEDPGLGSWVGKQRKLKRRFDRGEPCLGMCEAKVAKLDKLNFAW